MVGNQKMLPTLPKDITSNGGHILREISIMTLLKRVLYETFKPWLKITLHSFFVSLGVMLSFILIGIMVAIVILVIEVTGALFSDQFQQTQIFQRNSPAQIEIEWIKSRKSPTMVIFVGELKKDDERKYYSVKITLKLFDKDNKYVDDCSDFIYSPFKVSKTETFKIQCGGSSGYPPLEFAKYETNIQAEPK